MHRVYDVQLVAGVDRTQNNREIERKFLVKSLPDNLKQSRSFVIDQGYLATESAGRQVRLRKTGKATSLTFKVGRGSHREEREIKLSPKQFAALWPGTAGRRLRKVRYEIPWEDLLIEVDIYRGRHAGLVVAEVEFPDTASCRRFKAPWWFGREVTGEKRYSNVRLALK
jgi:adenylate cyclase